MKKLLIILSLSALVFGCDKHDNDYKKNIPDGSNTSKPEEPEEKPPFGYTLEDLNWAMTNTGVDGESNPNYRNVTRFIQGYMTVTDVNISGRVLSYGYVIDLMFEGPTIKGGPDKDSPCDDGFNEVADEYGDTYGQYDAVRAIFIDNPVIVACNNIKYYVYTVGKDYDDAHANGGLLNDIVTYNYNERDYRRAIGVGPWTETKMIEAESNLMEYDKVDKTMLSVEGNSLTLPFPANADTYTFRIVAKNGEKILCDKVIEDIELPARIK
ncbi:MAG: hypothetical protein K2L01_00165 [Rikenellaceae bacterium]|nr:hypothetical protein [Rikenellaceae bacterium]